MPQHQARVFCIDGNGHRSRVLARRDALVLDYLALVEPIARAIRRALPPSFDLEDLVSAGTFGLIRAATRYRPAAHGDTPFSAFARPRIRGAIIDSIRRRNWIENTREEIPENFEMPFMETFADDLIESIDEGRARVKDRYGRLRDPLTAALQRLTARQRAVLGCYYAENVMSIADTAELLGLSTARVRREHGIAIAALRLALGADNIAEG